MPLSAGDEEEPVIGPKGKLFGFEAPEQGLGLGAGGIGDAFNDAIVAGEVDPVTIGHDPKVVAPLEFGTGESVDGPGLRAAAVILGRQPLNINLMQAEGGGVG